MRLAIGLEYDGTAYHGWQTQTNPPLNTIQEQVEQALSKIANHPVAVVCAGRTDRGVHALEQIIHADVSTVRELSTWLTGFNHFLPKDIRGIWIQQVPDEFHARFSASSRSYRYIIYNHPIRPVLWRNRVTFYPFPLNEKLMHSAAQYLLGEHDFSSFRGSDCQAKTTIRTVEFIQVEREGDYLTLKIRANAFLHHMVRNIVGALMEVGTEKKPVEWLQEVLQGKNRKLAGVTADACGLYLEKITYPSDLWSTGGLARAPII